jgi:hypothetical protein
MIQPKVPHPRVRLPRTYRMTADIPAVITTPTWSRPGWAHYASSTVSLMQRRSRKCSTGPDARAAHGAPAVGAGQPHRGDLGAAAGLPHAAWRGQRQHVYWYMWLDTTGGPLVLELINDIWSRWVVDLGITSIGIKKGQPFAPDARMKGIPVEATRVGDATARAIFYRYCYPNSAWRMLAPGGYRFEQDGARLWDSYISFCFGGLACLLVWQPPIEEEHERGGPEALHDRVATVPWTPSWGQAARIQMGLSQEPRAQERTMLPRCLCRMLYR